MFNNLLRHEMWWLLLRKKDWENVRNRDTSQIRQKNSSRRNRTWANLTSTRVECSALVAKLNRASNGLVLKEIIQLGGRLIAISWDLPPMTISGSLSYSEKYWGNAGYRYQKYHPYPVLNHGFPRWLYVYYCNNSRQWIQQLDTKSRRKRDRSTS